LLRVVRGGDDLTILTLARFFGAHIWFLPASMFGLIGVHLYLVIRNGISHVPRRGE
jgi:quinol-cytochrome oxidoreductase complex cytochrome b subunit